MGLLASRQRHYLPQYIAWKPNPNIIAINAEQQEMNKNSNHAFPPFCMINQILHTVIREDID